MSDVHVHGARERQRLEDRSGALVELLHHDAAHQPGSRVLEAGCGVQTMTLAGRSPGEHSTSVEVSPASLAQARAACERGAPRGGRPHQPHVPAGRPLPPPVAAGVLRPRLGVLGPGTPGAAGRRLHGAWHAAPAGGTVAVIAGDHGSAHSHPDDPRAPHAISCLVALQALGGGDAHIGRRLYRLPVGVGFREVRVDPGLVHADAIRPGMVDGFTRRTFSAMVEGVRQEAVAAGPTDPDSFDSGVAARNRTAEAEGVFCCSFKGVACAAGAP